MSEAAYMLQNSITAMVQSSGGYSSQNMSVQEKQSYLNQRYANIQHKYKSVAVQMYQEIDVEYETSRRYQDAGAEVMTPQQYQEAR